MIIFVKNHKVTNPFNMSEQKFRVESDLIGELQVPADAYYGVQTQRAINNYKISNTKMCDYPEYIIAMAYVKMAAAAANTELGVLDKKIGDAIVAACKEIVGGKLWDQFPVDMMQGGAGTSVNMNANEVIANRALELMGHQKGEYQFCSPNDHVNCAQSTNDAYPTAFRYTFVRMNKHLEKALKELIAAFRAKGEEFKDIIKMGRTQLQDAVPMPSGQEFNAFANNLEEELANLERNALLLKEINMGGTAIGTGLNAVPGFAELCTEKLSEFCGDHLTKSPDLVEATPDTGAYVSYSAALKRLAVKLSKICNDLRLMASGPRCGLGEISIPENEPGSSIMPGKVNPTQCESMTMVAVQIIGNDTVIGMAASQGNFQLNVFLPVTAYNFLQSVRLLSDGLLSFEKRCVSGIRPNPERMKENLNRSLMLVTALSPEIGYEKAAEVAKTAYREGLTLKEAGIRLGYITEEIYDRCVKPEEMV